MRKKFKQNAGKLDHFDLEIVAISGSSKCVRVTLSCETVIYTYDFYVDVHFPDVNELRDSLEKRLDRAKKDFDNLEITEDKDHPYLSVQFQGDPIRRYSGRRVS